MTAKALSSMAAAAALTGGELFYAQQAGTDVKVTTAQIKATSYSGVDPTGATDSTAGLQAAIDATPTGGTLIIPTGTYKLIGSGNRILNRTTAIRIIGDGLPILSIDSSVPSTRDIIRFAPSVADSTGWQISWISIYGGFGRHAIYLDCSGGASAGWIANSLFSDNVILATAGGHSIHLNNNTTAGGLAYSTITRNLLDSVYLANSGDNIEISYNTIYGVFTTNIALYGYSIVGAAATKIIGNILAGTASLLTWDAGINVIIRDNEFEANVANSGTSILSISSVSGAHIAPQLLNNSIVGLNGTNITTGISVLSGVDGTLIMGGRIDVPTAGTHISVLSGALNTHIDSWSICYSTHFVTGAANNSNAGTGTLTR